MKYWLMKSEPFKYSWDQLIAEGWTHWEGVRSYQASNNMKKMALGDLVFFYHSNKGLEIVGVAKVSKLYYPDHTDESGRFGMVNIEPVKVFPEPVTLKQIKATKSLENMILVKQSRLSVSDVQESEWKIICKMGKITL